MRDQWVHHTVMEIALNGFFSSEFVLSGEGQTLN